MSTKLTSSMEAPTMMKTVITRREKGLALGKLWPPPPLLPLGAVLYESGPTSTPNVYTPDKGIWGETRISYITDTVTIH